MTEIQKLRKAADAYVTEQGIEHSGGIVEAAFEAGAAWNRRAVSPSPVVVKPLEEMDDEDRTPTPAGYDEAIWRKADEAHHATALVADDVECVKIIYAALEAALPHIKGEQEPVQDAIAELRAALSEGGETKR